MVVLFSAWLQCTHLNVAAEKNGATCTSSSYANAARQCDKAIDGRAEFLTFAFNSNSSRSVNHSIKIQFAQYFLINKLRVMQLDSGNMRNMRLEFSNSSSLTVRFKRFKVKKYFYMDVKISHFGLWSLMYSKSSIFTFFCVILDNSLR